MSPSWGWSYLVPFGYAFGPEVHSLTMLWIGGLLAPIAYWVRRAIHPRRARWHGPLVPVIVVGLGLGVLPVIAHFPPVHWSEWFAAAAGLCAGWFLAPVVEVAPLLSLDQARAKSCTLRSGQR
jgi:hypothetical protein